jgi:hypothetical protein
VLFLVCGVACTETAAETETETEREKEEGDDDDDGELLRLLDMHISKLTEMEEVAECGN